MWYLPYENFEFLCNLWPYRFVGTHVGVKYILLRLSLIGCFFSKDCRSGRWPEDWVMIKWADNFYYGLEMGPKCRNIFLLSTVREIWGENHKSNPQVLWRIHYSFPVLRWEWVPQTLYLGSLDVCITNTKSMNKYTPNKDLYAPASSFLAKIRTPYLNTL